MDESNFYSRRKFIEKSIYGGIGIIGLSSFSPLELPKEDLIRLSILHTNDIHSRIEPFPVSNSRYSNRGGLSRIAELVEHIRANENNVLLFDAGDIFQGTPYFNYFGGEVEFKLMSAIGYDAATIGNHDFDNGIDGLNDMLPFANFPFLSANYDFSDTILNGKTKPFKIFQKEELKVGVFGIGIELNGLVNSRLYKNTGYQDPIFQANKFAHILSQEMDCDYVICLSHLGFDYKDGKVSDTILASQSEHIDLIIGGHTHTFMDEPFQQKNINNQPVLIHQVGWAGLNLGKIDLVFEKAKKKSKKRNRSYSSDNQ